MGYAMDGFSTLDLALFAAGTFAAASVTGLAKRDAGSLPAVHFGDVLRPAAEVGDRQEGKRASMRAKHSTEADMEPYRIAVLWRGDREARQAATPQNNRYHRIFEELAALGIHAEPAVYDEAFADEVREQLLAVDGVLVWVDPLIRGRTRAALDATLRDVASRGPWVSAHPDVILKMGVKDCCTARSISAGGPIPTSTAPLPSSVRRSRRGSKPAPAS
jgi:hypothetical protein